MASNDAQSSTSGILCIGCNYLVCGRGFPTVYILAAVFDFPPYFYSGDTYSTHATLDTRPQHRVSHNESWGRKEKGTKGNPYYCILIQSGTFDAPHRFGY